MKIKDCFILMDAWNKMKNVTKVNICALCVPFRDKYKLTDLQTLMIARGEMKASQILEIGKNLEKFGPRFPDVSDLYTASLSQLIKENAAREQIPLEEGVYLMCSGPNYETPAEIRAFRTLGADAVGMSTVPEALVAGHSGLQVVGVSCITNMAAGVLPQKLDHSEVVQTAAMVHDLFHKLVNIILRSI